MDKPCAAAPRPMAARFTPPGPILIESVAAPPRIERPANFVIFFRSTVIVSATSLTEMPLTGAAMASVPAVAAVIVSLAAGASYAVTKFVIVAPCGSSVSMTRLPTRPTRMSSAASMARDSRPSMSGWVPGWPPAERRPRLRLRSVIRRRRLNSMDCRSGGIGSSLQKGHQGSQARLSRACAGVRSVILARGLRRHQRWALALLPDVLDHNRRDCRPQW